MRISSYKDFLNTLGARWGTLNGVDIVQSFGDSREEYRVVRGGGLAIADRSERETLIIDGDDAATWLQGMVTNHVYELAEPGAGHLTTVVNLHGRLVAEMRLMHVQDMLIADLEPGTLDGPLVPHFRRHIIMEKVNFLDRRKQISRLGIYGAHAALALEKVANLAHPLEGMAEYHGTWGDINDEDVIVQKILLVGVDGFEISCGAESAGKLWTYLQENIEDLTPIGFDALETLRIEAGVPRFGAELDEKTIPLEAELQHAINYTKGCYLGQEIIARLDTRGEPARLLRTLVLAEDSPVPEVGANILDGNKIVGSITSACYSEVLNRPIALAFIKRKHNDIGHKVVVEHEEEKYAADIMANGFALTK